MKSNILKILTLFFCCISTLLFSQSWEKLEQDYINQLNKKEFKSAKITANKMKHVSLQEYGDTSSYYMKSLYHLSFFDLHDNNDTSAIKILEEAKRYFNTETKKGLYLYHRILLDLSNSYYFTGNYNKVYDYTNELLQREDEYKYFDNWELIKVFKDRAESCLKTSQNVASAIKDISWLVNSWISQLEDKYSNHEDDETAEKILGQLNSCIDILYNYYLLESDYKMALKVFELYNGLKKFELPDLIKYHILDIALANQIMLGLDADIINTTNNKIELLKKGNILPLNSSDFYFVLGQNYLNLKDYKNALEFTIKSIDLSKPTDLHPLYNKNGQLGDIFSRTEMYEWAIQAYNKKKNLMVKENVYTNSDDINYNLNMASLNNSLEKYDTANTFIEKLLSNHNLSKTDLQLVFGLKSTVLLSKHKYENAIEYEYKSFKYLKDEIVSLLTVLSNAERESLIKSKDLFFNSFIETSLLDAKNFSNDLAFDVMLFRKNLLLESERATYSLITKDSLLKKQFEKLFFTKKIVSNMSFNEHGNYSNNYYSLLDTVSFLERMLMRSFPDNMLSTHNTAVTFSNVKNSLAIDECAIEFTYSIRQNKKYYSALLTLQEKSHPISVNLINEETLDSINNLIDENYSSNNLSGRTFELNKHLYHMFWEPLEPYLKRVKTIFYSPIDELNNMSFSTFITNSNDTTYLMDKYNLQSVMSTAAIITNKTPSISNIPQSIALFGGVQYNLKSSNTKNSELIVSRSIRGANKRNKRGDEILELPFTKNEIDNVSGILQKANWTILKESDNKATENKIKELKSGKNPTILHFATHGFSFPDFVGNSTSTNIFENSENPMQRSGLLFYGASDTWQGKRDTVLKYTGEDGVLTAEEVSNLDLTNTKLVVMSACQSGLGAIKGTEGVYGLKRAFKLAGVENMIVSLWPVPDKETMELMNLFYEELVKTKDINESFQKAQKTMRYKYPNNPWAWGGFVLVR